MKRNEFRNIKNLRDLEVAKLRLKKKIKLRQRLLDIHLKQLSEDANAQYLINHTIKGIGINNPFIRLMPNLIKNALNTSQKGLFASLASAVTAGLATFFVFNIKNKKGSNSEE